MKEKVIDFRETSAPGDTITGGLNINRPAGKWTGNKLDVRGHNVHVIGHGKDATTLTGSEITVWIADNSGRVTLEGMTIVCGNSNGIVYGSQRGWWDYDEEGNETYVPYHRYDDLYTDSQLVLRDVRIITREPAPSGHPITTQWPMVTVNVDHAWRDVEVLCKHSKEHVYLKGWARYGFYARNVDMDGAGGECIKFSCRPAEAHWVPGARCEIQDMRLHNWGAVAWGGGGGLVFQGPGFEEIYLERVLGIGRSGESAVLRFDDGLSTVRSEENNAWRYYDTQGVEGGSGNCVDRVLLRHVGMYGINAELLRVGTIYKNAPGIPAHNVVGMIRLEQIGAYGIDSRITLKDVPVISWQLPNSEPVREYLSQYFSTKYEATYNGRPMTELTASVSESSIG